MLKASLRHAWRRGEIADFARFAYNVPWRPTNVRELRWDAVDLGPGRWSSSRRARLESRCQCRWSASSWNCYGSATALPATGRLTVRTQSATSCSTTGGEPIAYRCPWKRATATTGLAGLWFYDLKRSAIRKMPASSPGGSLSASTTIGRIPASRSGMASGAAR